MGKSNSTTVEEVAVRGISIAHPGPPAGDPSPPVPGRSGENAGCFWRMPACPSLLAPTQMHGDKENNCKPDKPHKGRLAPLLHKVPISQKVPMSQKHLLVFIPPAEGPMSQKVPMPEKHLLVFLPLSSCLI